MARILLGVSGGIAAYKALEFVRLATERGHVLRVVQTPTSRRFVGEASFAALSGAPVLAGEFERDPARGAFPGQTPPDHEPPSHLLILLKLGTAKVVFEKFCDDFVFGNTMAQSDESGKCNSSGAASSLRPGNNKWNGDAEKKHDHHY